MSLLNRLLAFLAAAIFSVAAHAQYVPHAFWSRTDPSPVWIGAFDMSNAGFAVGGSQGSTGTGDGQFNTPDYLATDGSYVYVTDKSNNRIVRVSATTGIMNGWIGYISTAPTGGDPGCSGKAANNYTPGWCRGGSAKSGAVDGAMNTPRGLYVHGTLLYLADQNNTRLSRYNINTGAYLGWLGGIGSSPTGGDPGCNGASVGTFTPGWCLGGTGAGGTYEGSLGLPVGVAGDGSYLYVSDNSSMARVTQYNENTGAVVGWIGSFQTNGFVTGGYVPFTYRTDGAFANAWDVATDGTNFYASDQNHRIQKFDANWAFVGWIGKIGGSPTAGDAGCSGAAVGTFTPGWCKGGNATSGSGDGMVNSPIGLLVVGSSLYVSDYNNGRIERYTHSTGAFTGWIGNVLTAPTGGDAGCNGAPTGAFTPGWCKGGTSSAGTGNGMITNPEGLESDGTTLYVGDLGNQRVDSYSLSTGAFQGWIGRVSTSPTGGAAGCSGLATNNPTPGWCLGGTATSSATGDGSLISPTKPLIVGSNLYVSNSTSIRRFTTSTGAFTGWIGKINASPTGGDAGCSGASNGGFTPGWCTGGSSTAGTGDGHVSNAGGLSVSGTNLYYADPTLNRISRYTLATGAFTGWLGKILTSPTSGDAGCSGASVGSFTPGWCKGGTTTSGNGDGALNFPYGLYNDGTSLFVDDRSNNRISKYTLSTGAFAGWLGLSMKLNFSTGGIPGMGNTNTTYLTNLYGMDSDGSYLYLTEQSNATRISRYSVPSGTYAGWIGVISTVPTGGDAGCTSASVNTFTPGWCQGGIGTVSSSYFGIGGIYNPHGVHVANGNLYMASNSAHTITKYVASTGAFVGWQGRIITNPTGGDTGCNGAGGVTPGWCTGGGSGSTAGIQDRMFNSPNDILSVGSNVWVADGSNNRVCAINESNGSFTGCIGSIGVPTNGWSTSSSPSITGSPLGDGVMAQPGGIYTNGSYVYVMQTSSSTNQIERYDITSGAFRGWLGGVGYIPTGGDPGCNGAANATLTPGWCLGGSPNTGSAANGSGYGSMTTPTDMVLVGTNIYVTTGYQCGIQRYNATTWAFTGWLGKVGVSPTGGDPGCSGAAVNSAAPGWCMGGSLQASSNCYTPGDGMYLPNGMDTDGSYLYASDINNGRITRTKFDGTFGGWIGRIITSPTGGDAGCNGAPTGGFSPGWCKGGLAGAGTATDGSMTFPSRYGGLKVNGSYLYSSDYSTLRVNRYLISTGAFTGWLGHINTAPTGGATGCSGASGATPGWCLGGTSNGSSNGDGSFSAGLSGVEILNGRMYAGHRGAINRYDLNTGIFTGWLGRANAAPTGGDAGCASTASGSLTPGWCKGGTFQSGTGNGMTNNQTGKIIIYNNYLYETDTTANRLIRYNVRP